MPARRLRATLVLVLSLFLNRQATHPRELLARTAVVAPVAAAPAAVPAAAAGEKPKCCGPGCRVRDIVSVQHYDQKYFDWQTKEGVKKANAQDWTKFLSIKPGEVVADLGAGGGHILGTMKTAGRKIAVEVNPSARAGIARLYPDVEMFVYPEEVPNNSIDVLYSTSAIEHFECPLTELREMARKVKVGGRVAIGVKNEGVPFAARINRRDINQHLWTWNHQQLFNLLEHAGFKVIKVDPPPEQAIADASLRTVKAARATGTFVYLWAWGVKA